MFSGYFVQAGTVAEGDGDSGCGIAGTVAIGDRDNGGVYSWDSAEGLGQQARVLCLYRRRMLRLCELTWRKCSGKRKPRKLTWRECNGKRKPLTRKIGIFGEVGQASERKVVGHIFRRAIWWWYS